MSGVMRKVQPLTACLGEDAICNFIKSSYAGANCRKCSTSCNRKTNRADYNAKTANAAVKFAQDDSHSLLKAQEYLVATATQDKPIQQIHHLNKYAMPRKAIPDNFQKNLAKCAKKASQSFKGVSYCALPQLVCRFGDANNVLVPSFGY